MRILHVIRPADGGMRAHLQILLAGLSDSGYEVGLVSPNRDWNDSLTAKGLPAFWAPIADRPGPKDLMAMSALAKAVREFNPDFLHCHGLRAAWLGRPVAKILGLPVVVTYHTSLDGGGRWRQALTMVLERFMARWNTGSIAVSGLVSADLDRRLGLRGRHVAAILNGIDLTTLTPERPREEIRAMLRFSNEDLVIGTVARLARQKDLETLIRAAYMVVQESFRPVFILIGDGPERARLERLVDELSLRGRVRFLGHREDIPELLSAMDLFALSSRSEGAPLAVMEAMAMGLPVVATRAGGLPELVPEGRAGFLVPPGDAAALAGALLRLADEPDVRAMMAREARAWAHRCFARERMIAETSRFYEAVFSQGHL